MTEQVSSTVRHVPDRFRHETEADGGTVGLTACRDRGEQRVFCRTETYQALSGREPASRLVGEVLGDVRRTGRRVVPVRPCAKVFLEKHGPSSAGG